MHYFFLEYKNTSDSVIVNELYILYIHIYKTLAN